MGIIETNQKVKLLKKEIMGMKNNRDLNKSRDSDISTNYSFTSSSYDERMIL